MSWHTAGLYFNHNFALTSAMPAEMLSALGFVGLDLVETCDFEEATSMNLNAVAFGIVQWKSRTWTAIFNSPDMFGSGSLCDQKLPKKGRSVWPRKLQSNLLKLSWGYKSIGFLAEGSTGTYGFSYIFHGKVKRQLLYNRGTKVITDQGEPLLPEAKLKEPFMEFRILTLVERLTVPFATLDKVKFHVYTYDEAPK